MGTSAWGISVYDWCQLHVATTPFTVVDGSADTYTFSQIGSWGKPICEEAESLEFTLDDLLGNVGGGVESNALCAPIEGYVSSHTSATLWSQNSQFQFTTFSSGLADSETEDAFSRHDLTANFEFEIETSQRIRIDYSLHAGGLSSVYARVRRVGGSWYKVFEEELNAYIEPLWLDGFSVLALPAGSWEVTLWSTHQAMNSKAGFEQSVSDMQIQTTFVSLGDVDGDGSVNTEDLLAIISAWGTCDTCQEDLDGDDIVGVSDVLTVISHWG